MSSSRDSIVSSLVSLSEGIVGKVNELAQEEEECKKRKSQLVVIMRLVCIKGELETLSR